MYADSNNKETFLSMQLTWNARDKEVTGKGATFSAILTVRSDEPGEDQSDADSTAGPARPRAKTKGRKDGSPGKDKKKKKGKKSYDDDEDEDEFNDVQDFHDPDADADEDPFEARDRKNGKTKAKPAAAAEEDDDYYGLTKAPSVKATQAKSLTDSKQGGKKLPIHNNKFFFDAGEEDDAPKDEEVDEADYRRAQQLLEDTRIDDPDAADSDPWGQSSAAKPRVAQSGSAPNLHSSNGGANRRPSWSKSTPGKKQADSGDGPAADHSSKSEGWSFPVYHMVADNIKKINPLATGRSERHDDRASETHGDTARRALESDVLPPSFLSEFKERSYDDTGRRPAQRRRSGSMVADAVLNIAGGVADGLSHLAGRQGSNSVSADKYSAQEIRVRRQLEEARLENLRLRQVAVDHEVQAMKLKFFSEEVTRLQDMVNCESQELEKLRRAYEDADAQHKAKTEENSSLAAELVSSNMEKTRMQADVSEAKQQVASIRSRGKQEEARRRMEQQKRQQQEHENKGFFGFF